MRRTLCVLVAAGLVGCGAPDPRVVVDVGAPVIVDPAPDRPGFDPRSARLRVAAREVARIAGHPILLRVDAALLSNDPRAFEETLARAVAALAQALARIQGEDPDALALALPKLREVSARYEPLAPRDAPRARLEDGGKRLTIELSTRTPDGRELVPTGAMLDALRDAYDDATEARFRGGLPTDTGEREAYFAWLTRTRPGRGSVVVTRAVARAGSAGRPAAEREAAARVRLAVLELEAKAEAPELHARIEAWLVDELPRLEWARRDAKKLALLSREDTVFRAERAYDRWVSRRFFALPERLALRLADALFPHGRPCAEGELDGCAASTLPGVDRAAIGAALLEELRRSGYDATRAEHPALVTRIVCPAQRDPRGKTHESCNASFAALVLASPSARARLLQTVIDAREPRFAAEVAATLHYARGADVAAYLRGLDAHPGLYLEAVRALVFGLWNEHRAVLEEEARRAWTRDTPEHRAAALTVLAESRGKLHRHYADGYFARFASEWGALGDTRAVTAMLAGAPRAFAFVPRLWLGLDRAARVEPLIAGLDRLLAAPEDALEEPATATLSAVIARLCEDHALPELERLRHALAEASRRGSPELRQRLANVLEDSDSRRCPAKAAPRDHGY